MGCNARKTTTTTNQQPNILYVIIVAINTLQAATAGFMQIS